MTSVVFSNLVNSVILGRKPARNGVFQTPPEARGAEGPPEAALRSEADGSSSQLCSRPGPRANPARPALPVPCSPGVEVLEKAAQVHRGPSTRRSWRGPATAPGPGLPGPRRRPTHARAPLPGTGRPSTVGLRKRKLRMRAGPGGGSARR